MTNAKNNKLIIPLLVLSIVAGMVFYMIRFEPTLNLKMLAIVIITVPVLAIPLYRNYKNAQDRKSNIPLEDEMTHLLEIHAGAYAYRWSMMLWFLIFIFRNKFPDSEEMLGIGIMSSAAIYGFTWLYMKKTGLPDET
ncbi:hypothetical protein HQ531_03955 [bacterium]|nr:hypothetical protein [bacterium]